MRKYEKEITRVLKEKYPHARIEIERGKGLNPVFIIITPDFKKKTEKNRQKEIWGWLREKLNFDIIKHIGFILTMTPEEEKAYAE